MAQQQPTDGRRTNAEINPGRVVVEADHGGKAEINVAKGSFPDMPMQRLLTGVLGLVFVCSTGVFLFLAATGHDIPASLQNVVSALLTALTTLVIPAMSTRRESGEQANVTPTSRVTPATPAAPQEDATPSVAI